MRVSTVVLQVFSLINDNFFCFICFLVFTHSILRVILNYKLNLVRFEPRATGSAKSFFRKYL